MLGQTESRQGGRERRREGGVERHPILPLVLTSLGREGGVGVRGLGGKPVFPLALNYLELTEGGSEGVKRRETIQASIFNSPQSPEMRTPVCSSYWAGSLLLGPETDIWTNQVQSFRLAASNLVSETCVSDKLG